MRCKNVTTWYVDDRVGQPQQPKVIIQCTQDAHGPEALCSAVAYDSDPPATVLWQGTTSDKRPTSHG